MSGIPPLVTNAIGQDAKIQFIKPESLRGINDGQWNRLRTWLSNGNVNDLNLPAEFHPISGLLKDHFAKIKPKIPVKLTLLYGRGNPSEHRNELVSNQVVQSQAESKSTIQSVFDNRPVADANMDSRPVADAGLHAESVTDVRMAAEPVTAYSNKNRTTPATTAEDNSFSEEALVIATNRLFFQDRKELLEYPPFALHFFLYSTEVIALHGNSSFEVSILDRSSSDLMGQNMDNVEWAIMKDVSVHIDEQSKLSIPLGNFFSLAREDSWLRGHPAMKWLMMIGRCNTYGEADANLRQRVCLRNLFDPITRRPMEKDLVVERRQYLLAFIYAVETGCHVQRSNELLNRIKVFDECITNFTGEKIGLSQELGRVNTKVTTLTKENKEMAELMEQQATLVAELQQKVNAMSTQLQSCKEENSNLKEALRLAAVQVRDAEQKLLNQQAANLAEEKKMQTDLILARWRSLVQKGFKSEDLQAVLDSFEKPSVPHGEAKRQLCARVARFVTGNDKFFSEMETAYLSVFKILRPIFQACKMPLLRLNESIAAGNDNDDAAMIRKVADYNLEDKEDAKQSKIFLETSDNVRKLVVEWLGVSEHDILMLPTSSQLILQLRNFLGEIAKARFDVAAHTTEKLVAAAKQAAESKYRILHSQLQNHFDISTTRILDLFMGVAAVFANAHRDVSEPARNIERTAFNQHTVYAEAKNPSPVVHQFRTRVLGMLNAAAAVEQNSVNPRRYLLQHIDQRVIDTYLVWHTVCAANAKVWKVELNKAVDSEGPMDYKTLPIASTIISQLAAVSNSFATIMDRYSKQLNKQLDTAVQTIVDDCGMSLIGKVAEFRVVDEWAKIAEGRLPFGEFVDSKVAAPVGSVEIKTGELTSEDLALKALLRTLMTNIYPHLSPSSDAHKATGIILRKWPDATNSDEKDLQALGQLMSYIKIAVNDSNKVQEVVEKLTRLVSECSTMVSSLRVQGSGNQQSLPKILDFLRRFVHWTNGLTPQMAAFKKRTHLSVKSISELLETLFNKCQESLEKFATQQHKKLTRENANDEKSRAVIVASFQPYKETMGTVKKQLTEAFASISKVIESIDTDITLVQGQQPNVVESSFTEELRSCTTLIQKSFEAVFVTMGQQLDDGAMRTTNFITEFMTTDLQDASKLMWKGFCDMFNDVAVLIAAISTNYPAEAKAYLAQSENKDNQLDEPRLKAMFKKFLTDIRYQASNEDVKSLVDGWKAFSGDIVKHARKALAVDVGQQAEDELFAKLLLEVTDKLSKHFSNTLPALRFQRADAHGKFPMIDKQFNNVDKLPIIDLLASMNKTASSRTAALSTRLQSISKSIENEVLTRLTAALGTASHTSLNLLKGHETEDRKLEREKNLQPNTLLLARIDVLNHLFLVLRPEFNAELKTRLEKVGDIDQVTLARFYNFGVTQDNLERFLKYLTEKKLKFSDFVDRLEHYQGYVFAAKRCFDGLFMTVIRLIRRLHNMADRESFVEGDENKEHAAMEILEGEEEEEDDADDAMNGINNAIVKRFRIQILRRYKKGGTYEPFLESLATVLKHLETKTTDMVKLFLSDFKSSESIESQLDNGLNVFSQLSAQLNEFHTGLTTTLQKGFEQYMKYANTLCKDLIKAQKSLANNELRSALATFLTLVQSSIIPWVTISRGNQQTFESIADLSVARAKEFVVVVEQMRNNPDEKTVVQQAYDRAREAINAIVVPSTFEQTDYFAETSDAITSAATETEQAFDKILSKFVDSAVVVDNKDSVTQTFNHIVSQLQQLISSATDGIRKNADKTQKEYTTQTEKLIKTIVERVKTYYDGLVRDYANGRHFLGMDAFHQMAVLDAFNSVYQVIADGENIVSGNGLGHFAVIGEMNTLKFNLKLADKEKKEAVEKSNAADRLVRTLVRTIGGPQAIGVFRQDGAEVELNELQKLDPDDAEFLREQFQTNINLIIAHLAKDDLHKTIYDTVADFVASLLHGYCVAKTTIDTLLTKLQDANVKNIVANALKAKTVKGAKEKLAELSDDPMTGVGSSQFHPPTAVSRLLLRADDANVANIDDLKIVYDVLYDFAQLCAGGNYQATDGVLVKLIDGVTPGTTNYRLAYKAVKHTLLMSHAAAVRGILFQVDANGRHADYNNLQLLPPPPRRAAVRNDTEVKHRDQGHLQVSESKLRQEFANRRAEDDDMDAKMLADYDKLAIQAAKDLLLTIRRDNLYDNLGAVFLPAAYSSIMDVFTAFRTQNDYAPRMNINDLLLELMADKLMKIKFSQAVFHQIALSRATVNARIKEKEHKQLAYGAQVELMLLSRCIRRGPYRWVPSDSS